jgi:cation diffusion facilitator family transporter
MAESKVAVIGALAANIAIAVTKFAVAGVTGSSAMLSEGIHSTVDTANSILLLVGLRMSKRRPSVEHPFGHGKELYFWSLIVAILIFGVGGGVSAYEGILHILHPVPLVNPFWSYVVLAAAAVFEGASFTVALRQFLATKRPGPFWQELRRSKDPANYTVLAEDGAALAGLAAAAIGVYASHQFELPEIDGAASIVIGLLLAGVAVLLIREARGLLVGEGVRPETALAIRALAEATPGVRSAAWPLSMYIGPEEVLMTFDITFDADASAARAAQAVRTIEQQIRERYPVIKRIYIEVTPPKTEATSKGPPHATLPEDAAPEARR